MLFFFLLQQLGLVKTHCTDHQLYVLLDPSYSPWVDTVKKVKERVSVTDIENLTHRQAFEDALINTTTAFTNMWSRKRLNHDLRVLIRVLLRVRLCPERFMRYLQYTKNRQNM